MEEDGKADESKGSNEKSPKRKASPTNTYENRCQGPTGDVDRLTVEQNEEVQSTEKTSGIQVKQILHQNRSTQSAHQEKAMGDSPMKGDMKPEESEGSNRLTTNDNTSNDQECYDKLSIVVKPSKKKKCDMFRFSKENREKKSVQNESKYDKGMGDAHNVSVEPEITTRRKKVFLIKGRKFNYGDVSSFSNSEDSLRALEKIVSKHKTKKSTLPIPTITGKRCFYPAPQFNNFVNINLNLPVESVLQPGNNMHALLQGFDEFQDDTLNSSFNVLLLREYLTMSASTKTLIIEYSMRAKWLYNVQHRLYQNGIAILPPYRELKISLTKELLTYRKDLSEKHHTTTEEMPIKCLRDLYRSKEMTPEGALHPIDSRRIHIFSTVLHIAMLVSAEMFQLDPNTKAPKLFSDNFIDDIPFVNWAKPILVGGDTVTSTFSEQAIEVCGLLLNSTFKNKFFTDKFKPEFGDIYTNRYVVIKELGKGGFAAVWMVWDLKDNVFRAIKFMKIGNLGHGKEIIFYKQIQEKNERSNVSELKDYFTIYFKGRIVLCAVLSPVGNDLLKTFVHGSTPELENLAAMKKIIRGILKGVHFLHSNFIFHGDVKPSNILLETPTVDIIVEANRVCYEQLKKVSQLDLSKPDNLIKYLNTLAVWKNIPHFDETMLNQEEYDIEPKVKLTDFGLSCDVRERLNFLGFTRGYNAPEVTHIKKRAVFKMDIWSLGCTFFELVSGVKNSGWLNVESEYAQMASKQFFGEDMAAASIDSGEPVPYYTEHHILLRAIATKLKENCNWDSNEIELFSDFLTRMLFFSANDRSTTEECLNHLWFHDGNILKDGVPENI